MCRRRIRSGVATSSTSGLKGSGIKGFCVTRIKARNTVAASSVNGSGVTGCAKAPAQAEKNLTSCPGLVDHYSELGIAQIEQAPTELLYDEFGVWLNQHLTFVRHRCKGAKETSLQ